MMKAAARPDLPVVGLIGPTNLERISLASGVPVTVYEEFARGAATLIARRRSNLALVPDRGVALLGAHAYKAEKGAWIIGLVPDGGPSDSVASSNCRRNAALCDEVLDGFTWHHQHATLCELSDVVVCVGLSCGTLAEIAWTKWLKGPRVLALRPTFTAIPKEILAETDIVMVDGLEELDVALGREVDAVIRGPGKPGSLEAHSADGA